MRSFRLALALQTAVGMLTLTLLLGIVSTVVLRELLYRQLDGTLVHLAEVEAQAGAAHTSSEFQFHEGVLLSARSSAGAELTRYAQLWTSEGRPLIRSANLTQDLVLPREALAEAAEGRVVWNTHRWQGQSLRCVVYPLRLVGAAHGIHLLQVAAPLAPLDRTLRDFVLLGLALTVGAVGAAFLVGWRIAGGALQPTREITDQAEAIREGTHSPRITAHADVEEFARLVQVLNAMLFRLDQASAVQRRFTADASHELRGPLTALRGELDLALKRDRAPEEYRAVLARCREEVLRLSRLTTDLLTLARSEAGPNLLDQADTDLRDIAERVQGRFGALADERGLRLGLSGPAARVRGDPAMLERIVSNLVENAVKHTPPGGTILIEIMEDEHASLTVRDSGPGIPAEHLPHLFNRFFRGEPRITDEWSTGLGLAIAKAAAEAHGGSLRYMGNDPGAVFRMVLPKSRIGPDVERIAADDLPRSSTKPS
ncbi:MAG: ATP-binding protein [Gemmatimonadota bacterium]